MESPHLEMPDSCPGCGKPWTAIHAIQTKVDHVLELDREGKPIPGAIIHSLSVTTIRKVGIHHHDHPDGLAACVDDHCVVDLGAHHHADWMRMPHQVAGPHGGVITQHLIGFDKGIKNV